MYILSQFDDVSCCHYLFQLADFQVDELELYPLHLMLVEPKTTEKY